MGAKTFKEKMNSVKDMQTMIYLALIVMPVLVFALLYLLTRSVSVAAFVGIFAFVAVWMKALMWNTSDDSEEDFD